jgi:hypothetical protein
LNLSYCDQLNAIDRTGKVVSNFIWDSHDRAGYLWAIHQECDWHSSQATVVENRLEAKRRESQHREQQSRRVQMSEDEREWNREHVTFL